MNPLKISENLYRHYEKTQEVKAYYGLLAMWALCETAVEAGDDALLDKCRSYLALYPDNFKHPQYNFQNYRVGGPAKSWLVYKGLFDEERENLRKYAELTLKTPVDKDGVICHPNHPTQTWIDIAFCVPHFMVCAGRALGEQKYIDFAADQCFKMYERFLDPACGLLHQSRGFIANQPEKISEDHWSRGNGWGYLGLAALVEHLPTDSPYREKAERYFCELSRALLAYQTPRGVWRQEIPCEFAWDESSGTGLITYGFGVGMRMGLLDRATYEIPFRHALQAMVDLFINPDFSTNMCCQGCLCPGKDAERGTVKAYLTAVYPTYDDPHSFGCMMMAMVEAHRNGVADLHGRKWGNRVS